MHGGERWVGGEGRIRTYGPVAQTAALGKAASIRPLSHLSDPLRVTSAAAEINSGIALANS